MIDAGKMLDASRTTEGLLERQGPDERSARETAMKVHLFESLGVVAPGACLPVAVPR